MPKVSVIIPVYNGEKYLRQCLDSICAQTYSDIEIIIVDDGSTDTTPDILKDFREKDPRIRVFSQENKYAGVARNMGMSHATGEYLLFIDADDYIEPEAIEALYKKASENAAEICVCGAKQDYEGRNKAVYHQGYMDASKIPNDTEVFNRKTNPLYILNFTNPVVWNKLFLREFIEDKKLKFQPVRNVNDVFFVINAMCTAERITTLEEPFVVHRKNIQESLTGTLAMGGLGPFEVWTSTAEVLKEKGVFPEQSFVNRAVKSTLFILKHIYDYEVFCNAVNYLHNGALSKLCITEREDGYYYSDDIAEAVGHLIKDTPEDLLIYLLKTTVFRLNEVSIIKREKDQMLRIKNDKITMLREKLQQEREKLQKQKERIQQQKEKIQQQKEKLDEQDRILNSRSVKAIRKLRKW